MPRRTRGERNTTKSRRLALSLKANAAGRSMPPAAARSKQSSRVPLLLHEERDRRVPLVTDPLLLHEEREKSG